VDGGFTIAGGEAAMERLMEGGLPTAVLAANDLMALGAARHLLAAGVEVPGQVSVAGVDDIPLAAYGPVPLTTMRVPTYEIGRRGAELLLSALDDGSPGDVVVSGEIVERESVADRPESH
jgi:LacI family transcriptional regulator